MFAVRREKMKRLFGLWLTGLLLLGVLPAPVLAHGDSVKVMTRNQYLGADLTPIILAQTPEDFLIAARDTLVQITANNFPLRAQRLAAEIAFTNPDLIGLQEVFDFKLNDENVGPPFVDHLAATLDALAARGLRYVVAATVVNLDIDIPLDIDGDGNQDVVSVVDRDVILARKGITVTRLAGDFTAGGLCGVEIENPAPVPPFPVILQSTPSADGCNYSIVAQVDSPIGPISIQRGFVGVDATVRGKGYRFVNTHLEVMQPDPGNQDSAIIQFLQSVELVAVLKALTPDDLTLILLGDFNSSPMDVSIDAIIPPYKIITAAGFADVWDSNSLTFFDPNGFTCCQFGDLSNRKSQLDERIDIIFVGNESFKPLAFVTGQVPLFPLRWPPNWASDHGGVFGILTFSPSHRWFETGKKIWLP
jgi:endonuclease/exonuclease/phosphatase family metal-dependent hydrolase